jgi:TM2 domain-containing membrane protein YozV
VSQEWYYSVDGDRQGPVSAGELKKLADAGTLKQTDLVWKDGMADWAPAKSIKGLFGASSAANPAPTAKKAAEPAPARSKADDEDDRPARSRRRDEDEDEDDRPRRKPRDEDEDEDDDDRPARSRRRDEDDEEDDRRVRRRDEDDEDDRPVRRRDEDEDDDRPRRKKGGRVPEDVGSKKMVAGILGILLGAWGVHKFYLGFIGPGVIQIVLTILTCGVGGILGLIEGIIYLTKSDEDFYETYIVDQKAWF